MLNVRLWLLCRVWYPVIRFAEGLSALIGEQMETLFISMNNNIVRKMITGKAGVWKNALILLPHCLQNDDCKQRIVKTLTNCIDCGKCKISEINRVTRETMIEAKVATGGRLAKRWVEQYKPDFVIAVACERELCEGIPAVYPIPVVGVANERPNGPCINTDVDVKLLQQEIRNALGDLWALRGCE